jgi:hypothetical protein
MIIGNLGLVSVVSTFVVTFSAMGPDRSSILQQALWLLAALALNFVIIANPVVDGLLCRFLSWFLLRTTSLGKRRFVRLLSLDDEMTIAEHHLRLRGPVMLGELIPDHIDLSVVMIRGAETRHPSRLEDEIEIEPSETAVCFGKEDMHRRFADWLEREAPFRAPAIS